MATPLQDLEPDYVLAVSYTIKETSSEVNLKQLLTTLGEKGFSFQVRPDSPSSLLVFVKLSSYVFTELVEKDLLKNYEFGVTAKNGTAADRLRIVHQYLTNPEAVGGVGISPGKGNWDFVTTISPITSAFEGTTIAEDVGSHVDLLLTTSSIKESYGVQVALYFEFLKFYIIWLAPLAVLGGVSFLKSKGHFSLTYTFVNLLWGIGFLTFWNRKQQYLVNFWDVQNSHLVEEHNSELATLNKNFEIHGQYKHQNNHEGLRFLKQLTFIPVALVFVGALVSFQLLCFVIEIFLTEIYNGPGKALLALIPTILISAFVPILTIVFNIVSDKVIAWESHSNEYTKNNSILIKTYILTFLTSYAPLLITSFIYLPFAHLIEPNLHDIQSTISSSISSNRYIYKYAVNLKSQKEFKINQQRLNLQFFFFIVTSQVIGIGVKYILPLVLGPAIRFVKSKIGSPEPITDVADDEREAGWLANVRSAIKLPEYNVNDDYRGLVVQYGYLIIFGPVWSLAPLISLLFNFITFKMDKVKLSNGKYFKPPVPKFVDSIHPWNYALFLLTWIGSVISPIVTIFYRHGTTPPKTIGQLALDKASVNISSSAVLILTLFLSEHLFFVVYFVSNKVSNLFKSEPEIKNDFVENDLKLRRDYYSLEVKPNINPSDDGEWKKFSVDSVLKDAAAISKGSAKKSEEPVLEEPTTGVLSSYQKQDIANSQVNNRSVAAVSSPAAESTPEPTTTSDVKSDPVRAVAEPVTAALASAAAAGGAIAGAATATVAAASEKLTGSDTDKAKEAVLAEKKRVLESNRQELSKLGVNTDDLSDEKLLEKVKEKGDSIIKSKDSSGIARYATIDNNDHADIEESEVNGTKAAETSEAKAADTTVDTEGDFDTTMNTANSDFVLNAKQSAKEVDGKVNRKKSSLKKLLKKKTSSK